MLLRAAGPHEHGVAGATFALAFGIGAAPRRRRLNASKRTTRSLAHHKAKGEAEAPVLILWVLLTMCFLSVVLGPARCSTPRQTATHNEQEEHS